MSAAPRPKEIITDARCPGAFVQCGEPVRDYDANEEDCPLCDLCAEEAAEEDDR